MSIGWTVAGTLGQLMLALGLFMFATFAGGGLVTGNQLHPRALRLLDLSLFVLPGTCVVSTFIVIFLHASGSGVRSYGWYVLPLVATGLYLVFLNRLVRQIRRGGQPDHPDRSG